MNKDSRILVNSFVRGRSVQNLRQGTLLGTQNVGISPPAIPPIGRRIAGQPSLSLQARMTKGQPGAAMTSRAGQLQTGCRTASMPQAGIRLPAPTTRPQATKPAIPSGFNAAQRKAAQPGAPAKAKTADYVLAQPTHLGGGRQQIKVMIKGTLQAAGSVDIRPTSKGKVYISNLQVGRQFRRQGLATHLVNAALQTARQGGHSAASLEARPYDPGISPQALVSMYQRMGFKNVGTSKRGSPVMERHL